MYSLICKKCGKEFEAKHNRPYCQKGSCNPNWIDGRKKLPYSPDFTNELKLEIRKRDGFKCQCCGMTNEEHIIVIGYNLTIHHISYCKGDNRPENLITLCNQCNVRANYNREYWQEYYTNKINNTHFDYIPNIKTINRELRGQKSKRFCEICKKKLIYQKKFCSYHCANKFMDKKVRIKCSHCNQVILIKHKNLKHKLHFCNNICKAEFQKTSMLGKDNPSFNPRAYEEIQCSHCGNKINKLKVKIKKTNFCNIQCKSLYQKDLYLRKISHFYLNCRKSKRIKEGNLCAQLVTMKELYCRGQGKKTYSPGKTCQIRGNSHADNPDPSDINNIEGRETGRQVSIIVDKGTVRTLQQCNDLSRNDLGASETK